MLRLLQTSAAVTAMNLRSLPQRFWMSFATVVAVALMVGVLLAFLALANGFQNVLRGAGSDSVAIVLRDGAGAELNSQVSREQLRLIEEAPGVARWEQGALVSGELYVVVDGIKKASRTEANLTLRGIGPAGLALRGDVRIVEGRMFEPGQAEIVVGQSLLREFEGIEVGKTVRFGTAEWTVVGSFSVGGTVFESELWADVATVQSLFRRENVFQTARVRLESPAALDGLKAYLEADPRLKLAAETERKYYAQQAADTGGLILYLGWPLGILMSLGALAGALNTMYSSVAARTQEIATLRAIGFGGFPAFVGTLVESLILALLGGLVGAGGVFLLFAGSTASTFGGSFTQIVFGFDFSAALIAQGLGLALAVGFIGGLFPAWRAARVPLVAAFQPT